MHAVRVTGSTIRQRIYYMKRFARPWVPTWRRKVRWLSPILRFDFSHNKGMSAEELDAVETLANEIVLQNVPVNTRLMTVDAAVAEGAMALFGEKYGDEVRVVSMGRNGEGASRPIYSLELCGGTHVSRTGDIGLIKSWPRTDRQQVSGGLRLWRELRPENISNSRTSALPRQPPFSKLHLPNWSTASRA